MTRETVIRYANCAMCGNRYRKYHEKNVTCSKMCLDQKANAEWNEKWTQEKKKHKNMATAVKWGKRGLSGRKQDVDLI